MNDNYEIVKGLSNRDLQKESARVLTTWKPTVNELGSFNKVAQHDSRMFHIEIIKSYVDKYGDLPSRTGPAKDVKLLYE